MTDTELDVETLAQRIAARGHDALVERLRVAYSDAAAVHADIVSLDDARIEMLVQSAADRADGLQWRRALAGVAAEELDVSIPEALAHPAVARAQTLVGAPSYEQSLAELIARPVPPASGNGAVSTGAPAGAPTPALVEPIEGQLELDAEPEAESAESGPGADRLEAVEADDEVFELLPEPDPVELDTELYATQPEHTDEDAVEEPTTGDEPEAAEEASAAQEASAADESHATDEPGAAEPSADEDLRVSAVHLGGVANLPTHKEGLGLHLSGNGLDILEGHGEIIGRLVWEEIDALEVPHVRTRRRRQQGPRARLIVRTAHGDASFEITEFGSDELRDRIEPLIGRYGRH